MYDATPSIDSRVIFDRDLSTFHAIESTGPPVSLKSQVDNKISSLLDALDKRTPFPTIRETRFDVGADGALIGGAAKREAVASAMTGTSLPPVRTVAEEVQMGSAEKPMGNASINLIITASPVIEASEALVQRVLQIISLAEKTAGTTNLNSLNPHLRFSNVDLEVYVLKHGIKGTTLYKIRRENDRVVVDSLNRKTEKTPEDFQELLTRRRNGNPLTGANLQSLISADLIRLDGLTTSEKERLRIWKSQRISDGVLPERPASTSFGEEFLRILDDPTEKEMQPNYIPAATEILVAGIAREIQENKAAFKLVLTTLPQRGLEYVFPDDLNENVLLIPTRESWPPVISELPKKEKKEEVEEEDLFDE